MDQTNEQVQTPKSYLGILLAILITLVVATGLFYFFSTYFLKANTPDSNQALIDLQTQVANLQKQITQDQDSIKEIENIKETDNSNTPADWKSYVNEKYGFSFKYPSDWLISEKNNSYGLLKQSVLLNWKDGFSTSDSYYAQVYDIGSSNLTSREIVAKQYSEKSGEYGNVSDDIINGFSVIRYFGSLHSVPDPAGSASILFKNKSIAIEISTGNRNASSGQTLASLWEKIGNDEILNQIASSLKFIE